MARRRPWAVVTGALAADALALSAGSGRRTGRPAAILVSGMLDRLMVTPLVENLVRANVEAGTPIDTYFAMRPPSDAQNYAANKGESKWLVTEAAAERYTADPRIAKIRSAGLSNEEMFAHLCEWARLAGAGTCASGPEVDEPLALPSDEAHRTIMSYYNPLTTASGQNVLKRWRTIERLWARAKQTEQVHGVRYNSVLLVRDDDYWLTPYIFDTADFEAHPSSLKTISCLEAHGLNDKMIHLGRDAVDEVAMAYQAWIEAPHEALSDTRNAEEFLFKLAMARGVGLRPSGFNYALATTTLSGIPCFRKQRYNLTSRGGYHKCHDEDTDDGPVTKLHRTFSCDEMSPAFYSALGREQVAALRGAVAEASGRDRGPVVFTVVGGTGVGSAVRTLLSLSRADPLAKAVVVTTEDSLCETIKRQSGNSACVEMPGSVLDQKLRVALLTTALFTGETRGILFAEPGVEFQRNPVAAFEEVSGGRDVVFTARQPAQSMGLASGDDVSGSLFYVKDTPGGTHALMRAWMFLVEGPLPGGFYAGEPVVSSIDFDHGAHSLRVGARGTVRSASLKDPGRVVVDFHRWVGASGLALMPKHVAFGGPPTLLSRAVATSTGVRAGVVPCGRLGWERLPEEAA